MPTRTKSTSRHHLARAIALAAGLAAAATLAACGEDDPVQRALSDATTQLNAVSLGGAAPLPSVERRRKIYSDVASSLRSLDASADQTQAAAAGTLQARALAGLAEINASAAAQGESRFLAETIAARAVLDQWVAQNAAADVLGVYDPTKDLGDLDKAIEARGAEAQKARSDKGAQERVVADLRARAEQITQQARAIRAVETSTREQAMLASPQPRAGLIQQASAKRREADALERQAAELLARASVEAPKVDEFDRLVQRLETQQDLLRMAKVDIQARADAGKQHAARARGEAAQAGARAMELITALAQSRGELDKPSDDAARDYGQAVSAAKKAAGQGREGKVVAGVSAGTFQQSMGDVLSTKARSLGALVNLLQSAAGSSPALPNGQGLAAQLEAARASFSEATTQAEEAYKSALQSYQGSGASGELKPRVEAVTGAMTRLLEERERLSFDPQAAEQQIRAEFVAIAKLAEDGKFDEYASRLKFENDATRSVYDAVLPVQIKAFALSQALQEKFGKDLQTLLRESPAAQGNPMLAQLLGAFESPIKASTEIKLDVRSPSRAGVTIPGLPAGLAPAMQMVREDEVWKLSLALPEAAAAAASAMTPMMASMEQAIGGLQDDVVGGKFADATEFSGEFIKRVMSALVPGGTGGGGGGG